MADNSNDSIKLNALALANTFAIIDLILHPFFHIWVGINPESYEKLMELFVAGLELNVEPNESSLIHTLVGTVLETAVFWALGFTAAKLYNRLSSGERNE